MYEGYAGNGGDHGNRWMRLRVVLRRCLVHFVAVLLKVTPLVVVLRFYLAVFAFKMAPAINAAPPTVVETLVCYTDSEDEEFYSSLKTKAEPKVEVSAVKCESSGGVKVEVAPRTSQESHGNPRAAL